MTVARLLAGLAVALPFAALGDRLVDRLAVERPLFARSAGGRGSTLRDLARPATLVAVAVIVAIMVGWRFADASWIEMGAYAALFMVLITLSWIDAICYRLPDVVVMPTLIVGVVVVVAASILDDDPTRIRFALVGSAVAFAVLLVAHLISPRGMGFGDVKLAAVLGLAVGWQAASVGEAVVADLWLLLIGFAAGTVAGLVLLVARRRNQPFPFGPFLALGAVVTVMASRTLLG